MRADINIRSMEMAGEEMLDMSVSILRLLDETDDVKRKLSRQSGFSVHCEKLGSTAESIAGSNRKLRNLARALDNIRMLYSRAETAIEDNFEVKAVRYPKLQLGRTDISKISSKAKAILDRG